MGTLAVVWIHALNDPVILSNDGFRHDLLSVSDIGFLMMLWKKLWYCNTSITPGFFIKSSRKNEVERDGRVNGFYEIEFPALNGPPILF